MIAVQTMQHNAIHATSMPDGSEMGDNEKRCVVLLWSAHTGSKIKTRMTAAGVRASGMCGGRGDARAVR